MTIVHRSWYGGKMHQAFSNCFVGHNNDSWEQQGEVWLGLTMIRVPYMTQNIVLAVDTESRNNSQSIKHCFTISC